MRSRIAQILRSLITAEQKINGMLYQRAPVGMKISLIIPLTITIQKIKNYFYRPVYFSVLYAILHNRIKNEVLFLYNPLRVGT